MFPSRVAGDRWRMQVRRQAHREPLAGAAGFVCPLLMGPLLRAVAEVSGLGPVITAASVYQVATNPVARRFMLVISVVASRSLF